MRHVSAMAVARRERFLTDQATYQCMSGHAPWPWPGAPRTRAPPDVASALRRTADAAHRNAARVQSVNYPTGTSGPARSAVREAERQPQPSGAAAARGAAAGTRGRRAEPATPGMVMPT